MAVCVQKHEIQKGPLTHPTNPEVAACRAPVFGLRFVVSVIEVYREHYQSVFRFFRTLFLYGAHERALQHAMQFFSALGFLGGSQSHNP